MSAKEKLFTVAKERFPENKAAYDSDPENLGPRGYPYRRSLYEAHDILKDDEQVRIEDYNPTDFEEEFKEWLK